MSGPIKRLARLVMRNARLKRLARAVVVRVPFLHRRVHAMLIQGVLDQAHYEEGLPITPGDLSPRTARCLAELTRIRQDGR